MQRKTKKKRAKMKRKIKEATCNKEASKKKKREKIKQKQPDVMVTHTAGQQSPPCTMLSPLGRQLNPFALRGFPFGQCSSWSTRASGPSTAYTTLSVSMQKPKRAASSPSYLCR
eukprot:TRINITY_DN11547_c0_g1_i1.p3 TRINITY_DN11547_c0_g1~~TRINITY_DN11547_c0_g1_i1.p3  ORF type:complete len:114 (-),score=32.07 TRINITY_DN11547_c0_g1_i1:133-474(-)